MSNSMDSLWVLRAVIPIEKILAIAIVSIIVMLILNITIPGSILYINIPQSVMNITIPQNIGELDFEQQRQAICRLPQSWKTSDFLL